MQARIMFLKKTRFGHFKTRQALQIQYCIRKMYSILDPKVRDTTCAKMLTELYGFIYPSADFPADPLIFIYYLFAKVPF